jgi:hypothetical protein
MLKMAVLQIVMKKLLLILMRPLHNVAYALIMVFLNQMIVIFGMMMEIVMM